MASKERRGADGSISRAPFDLIEDVQQSIFKRMAYPISVWV